VHIKPLLLSTTLKKRMEEILKVLPESTSISFRPQNQTIDWPGRKEKLSLDP
jgi:hypothetical protein